MSRDTRDSKCRFEGRTPAHWNLERTSDRETSVRLAGADVYNLHSPAPQLWPPLALAMKEKKDFLTTDYPLMPVENR